MPTFGLPLTPPRRLRLTPVHRAALMLALGVAQASWAQDPATDEERLRMSSRLSVPLGGEGSKDLPVYFEADQIEGQPGISTQATGQVRLRRGDLTLRAEQITHTQADNAAAAVGNVRISRRGDVYSGPELRLRLDTLEGVFLHPTYRFARTGAGGQAERVDFLGPNRLSATAATYSSCTPDNTAEPDWVLSTSKVDLNFETNEGRAENAVVRFMGVPILAAPVLTFPLTEQRKSGFLPPSFDIADRGGFEFAQPYYWNIAPNRDATLTPTFSSRRGLGLEAETRYLYTRDRGTLRVAGLPDDRVARRSRGLVDFQHQGELRDGAATTLTGYDLRWLRVSDDDYWKDFRDLPSLTPRLYGSQAAIERQINTRAWGLGPNQTTLYARVQSWQTLQDLSPTAGTTARIINPYQREPQLGLRSRSLSESGWLWQFEGEFNRFTNQDRSRPSGNRLHALARVERPMGSLGWQFTPALSLNAASYDLDPSDTLQRRTASRAVPTLSLDASTTLEREVRFFGRDLVQTLEPRALYVYTPYRRQSDLPAFDSAERDFNQYSVFSESAFTGVDRVSDANQLTLGLSSRLLDPTTGAEALRVGVAQKVLLSDQRITPNDGAPITQKLSDLLLLGSASVIPHWSVDTTLQYNARDTRVARSLLGVRYSPGDFRTINLNYRFTRGSSEQIDLGWQWPLAGRKPPLKAIDLVQAVAPGATTPTATGTGDCKGTWYSVGRLSYSLRDKRLSDALLGLEYDGGCWITRIVAERVSIGRAEANTRLMFQLELVGLSRLGSSPLRALKDNIPGYRPVREDSSLIPPPADTAYFDEE